LIKKILKSSDQVLITSMQWKNVRKKSDHAFRSMEMFLDRDLPYKT